MWSFVFLFNQSRNDAAVEPNTEHFQGLVECRLQGQRLQNVFSRTPPLVVEQECEQEVFFELDDFDDSIKEKEDADFSTVDGQATCL